MKCRILKKGDKYYAQVETTSSLKGGKFSRTHKSWKSINWKSIKKKDVDQRDGEYEVSYFDSSEEAEKALRDYANEHSNGVVVKEFEV